MSCRQGAIECPECEALTLRDPKVHEYSGTRCEKCGAEFEVDENGELRKVASSVSGNEKANGAVGAAVWVAAPTTEH